MFPMHLKSWSDLQSYAYLDSLASLDEKCDIFQTNPTSLEPKAPGSARSFSLPDFEKNQISFVVEKGSRHHECSELYLLYLIDRHRRLLVGVFERRSDDISEAFQWTTLDFWTSEFPVT